MTSRFNKTSITFLNHLLTASLLLFILSSCTTTQSYILNEVQTIPLHPLDPTPKKMLILNTFDVSTKNYRNHKEELFTRLLDSVMIGMSNELTYNSDIPSEVLIGRTSFADTTITIQKLMKEYTASHAMIITDFNVNFVQTEVEITGEDKYGKDKVAHYDIESDIRYILYDKQGIVNEFPVTQSRFHSTRSVISGLLAAGPNVVENQDDALSIVRQNGSEYLNYFFPLWVKRTRKVFDKKELSGVREAISMDNYDAAFEVSRRYVHDPDRKLAAKANYNCAILMERKHQPYEAQLYMKESLGLYRLMEAESIKRDFGIF